MVSFSTAADILPFVFVDFAGVGLAMAFAAGLAATGFGTGFFGAAAFFAVFAGLTGLRAGALAFGTGLRATGFFAACGFFAGFAAFFLAAGLAAGLRLDPAIFFTIVPRRSRVIA